MVPSFGNGTSHSQECGRGCPGHMHARMNHLCDPQTLTWIFSPLEETKYLFRVGMWVWEARESQKTKPQATMHYRIRLVGMGVTGCLYVSGSPTGGGARTQVGGKVPGAQP